MPRKPKAKDGLTARERVALYEEKQAQKRAMMSDGIEKSTEKAENVPPAPDSAAGAQVAPVKPKKTLPKPQHATVRVDFGIHMGEIKPMHGMCNGPMSYGADISDLFREIGVPSVRFSGTDTAISSLAVDVSRIFKDPAADPHDAANYDFKCTDAYVTAAYNSGARVVFRLGESFDMSGLKTVSVPQDVDSWCEACVNIIKHYNDYWAGGYAFGIERFEIWGCEPAGDADRTASCELYRKLAGMIKLYDSSLKVGGMCFNDGMAARDFIKFCRKNHAPLDFITLSLFESDPVEISARIRALVPTLINLGFNDTEIIIGEWAYVAKNVDLSTNNAKDIMLGVKGQRDKRAKLFSEQSSIKGAAYALSTMLELLSIEEVVSAHHYDAQPAITPWCSICDRFGSPTKAFYAFKMFGELYRAGNAVYCTSEQTEGYSHTGIYAAAARASTGEAYVLISSFEGCGVVDVRLDSIPRELYTAQIYILDGVKNFSEGESVQISGTQKRLLLNISEYGAVLVKLF